ncbi:MAG: ATP-binding protein [bacterium]|jgi:predicted AAA+ superfamily ATPase
MRAVFENLIDDFYDRPLPTLVHRERAITVLPGKASVVLGMRRSGKTCLCYQYMTELMAAGTPKDRLLYLNFEDDRLLPMKIEDMDGILAAYFRRYPENKEHSCTFFFDEIQAVPGWEHFVRRLLDTENITVVVTGSSSRMLSREIATCLRGRSYATEVFPYSFREFLSCHHGEDVELNSPRWGASRRARVQHAAEQYLKLGGFPEVQYFADEQRRQVVRNYVDVVLLRDVLERYGETNVTALRALIHQCLAAPANRFSVTKFYNSLKSQGIACSKNTLYDNLAQLEDAYLLGRVPVYSRSAAVRRVNPAKIYASDVALPSAFRQPGVEDSGYLLENMVWSHLRARGLDLSYYLSAAGLETDFVCRKDDQDEAQLIQVCWSLRDEQTLAREVSSLKSAMNELKVTKGLIVTWMEEANPCAEITAIPFWKWAVEC